tara:strand:- start:8470 stop:8832 length:363 start_codon:yes stop_codon:yes gene_type:complete
VNDLDICKRIAEIEKDEGTLALIKLCLGVEGADALSVITKNPLTDDALLWRLAKKYRVSVTYWEQWQREQCQSECNVIAHIEMGSGIWCASSIYFREGDESLNKAICLAIIEAHKPNDEN